MTKQIIGQGPDIYIADLRVGQDTAPGKSLKQALTGTDAGRWVTTAANDRGPLVLAVNNAPQGQNRGTEIKDGGYVKANYLQRGQVGYAWILDNNARVRGVELKNNGAGNLALRDGTNAPVATLDEAHAASAAAVLRRIRGV